MGEQGRDGVVMTGSHAYHHWGSSASLNSGERLLPFEVSSNKQVRFMNKEASEGATSHLSSSLQCEGNQPCGQSWVCEHFDLLPSC